jgi:hypothetical protein
MGIRLFHRGDGEKFRCWAKKNWFGLISLLRQDHRKIVIRYRPDTANPLSRLCDVYGSDKGSVIESGHAYWWLPHTYTDYYHWLFSARRGSVSNVFECGIGTSDPALASSMYEEGKPGASLRVWRDYFPHAKIVGADIDEKILFQEDRIECFRVDQTNPQTIRELWSAINVDFFDIMIDDGLHEYEAGICLFENSIAKLAHNGIYVIEDVYPGDLYRYQKYFANRHFDVQFVSLFSQDELQVCNNLVVIQRGSGEAQ